MSLSYSRVGVRSGGEIPGLKALLHHLQPTFQYAPGAEPRIGFGYYANVIPVTDRLGIAISTDGVGTKLLVAQEMGRYDTVGIDCVAMNANDVVCVGARPVSMVDYVAVEDAGEELLGQLGAGLAEGARQAGISIPGGELAQIKEMIRGVRPGSGFDLVGTCIGTVALDRILTGATLQAGDAVLGLASSGVHSNGLTLARAALPDLQERPPELGGRSVGEELLTPTLIYVKAALALLDGGTGVRALAHITGDGFLNLGRVESNASFDIEALPEPPPIFRLIQQRGALPDAEMFFVFNMGVGFVAVVPEQDEGRALGLLNGAGYRATRIGTVAADGARSVYLRGANLVGRDGRFWPA